MSILTDESRKAITQFISSQANENRIDINSQLFSILEGQLEPLLQAKMLKDLGKKSYASAEHRMAPINYYRKVIDKVTSIYNDGVIRKVVNGTDADQDLVLWYEKILGLNAEMNNNNEALNAYKYSLLQISLSDKKDVGTIRDPILRTIPNNQFLIMNASKVDPTSPDVIIVFAGTRKNADNEDERIYYVYTDEEFMIINGNGNIMRDLMEESELDGENPLGVKPFVYANMSHNLVMPLLQNDDLAMALLIPLLLTDLNYAVKFQAFSMFVAIDIDDSKIEISPNVVQNLKSDPQGGDKPSFDTIKPQIDISDTLNLCSSQISLWLSSKGIRPGAVGDMSGDQFSSGISKMIDESDTFESRKKQIEIYKAVEREFWDILLKTMHPIWVAGGLIENRTIFSPSAEVVTEFQQPKPMQTRMELIEEIKKAIDAGLESRFGALSELHPDWDEIQIKAKIDEIDKEARQSFNSFIGEENGSEQDGNED